MKKRWIPLLLIALLGAGALGSKVRADIEQTKKESLYISKSLIVACDQAELRPDETVTESFGGLYVMDFSSVDATEEAYNYYSEIADFVDVNIQCKVDEVSAGESTEGIDTEIENTEVSEEVDASEEEVLEDTESTTEEISMEPEAGSNEDADDSKELLEETDEIQQPTIYEENIDVDYENTIAIIDTGIDINANVVQRVSLLDNSFSDCNGHGNVMAENIISEDARAKIVSIKTLGSNGKGNLSDVYSAMEWAIEHDVKIISLSVSAYSTEESQCINQAIEDADKKGIYVVCSAGNYGKNAKYYVPAGNDKAIVVGSCDKDGIRQDFSNFGDTVDYYLYSASTSQAASLMSGMLMNHIKIDDVDTFLDALKQNVVKDENMGGGNQTVPPPGSSLTNDIVVTQAIYALNLYMGYANNPWNGTGGKGILWQSVWTEENNTATSFSMPAQFSWMLNGFYDGWSGAYGSMYYNNTGTGTHVVNVLNSGGIVANWNTTYTSRIFDAGQYMTLNPDVYNSYSGNAFSAWHHYLLYGINEGRASSFEFNASEYGALYGDLKAAYGSNMWQYAAHYAMSGKAEGRFGSYNNTYFNGNGGTPSYSSKYTSYGHYMCDYYNHNSASQQPLPTASRTGYTFLGWFTAASGGTQVSDLSVCNNYTDFTLYAHWKINSYTVTCKDYLTDGTTYLGTPGTTTRNYGVTVSGSEWGTSSPYNNTQYTYSYNRCSNSTVSGNVTVYRYWTRQTNSYTITYNGNGGSPDKKTQSAPYGSAWGTLATASKTGYAFDGWYTAASGGTSITASTICSGNITVYAHWKLMEYKITFNAQGGSCDTSTVDTVNNKIASLPTAEMEYYAFLGWYTAEMDGEEVTTDTIFSVDSTVYAHWRELPFNYTVTMTSGIRLTADEANPSADTEYRSEDEVIIKGSIGEFDMELTGIENGKFLMTGTASREAKAYTGTLAFADNSTTKTVNLKTLSPEEKESAKNGDGLIYKYNLIVKGITTVDKFSGQIGIKFTNKK